MSLYEFLFTQDRCIFQNKAMEPNFMFIKVTGVFLQIFQDIPMNILKSLGEIVKTLGEISKSNHG